MTDTEKTETAPLRHVRGPDVAFERYHVRVDRVDGIIIRPGGDASIEEQLDMLDAAGPHLDPQAAGGMLLFLPRMRLVVVPTQRNSDGWGCVVVHGSETYPRGGYDLQISHREIACAIQLDTMVNGSVSVNARAARPLVTEPRPVPATISCDRYICGAEFVGDHLVDSSMPQARRHETVRAHARTLGWRCDETGDWCPPHTGLGEVCCDSHRGGPDHIPAPLPGQDDRVIGECCDPDDCGPCCPHCPTCPTRQRQRYGLVDAPANAVPTAALASLLGMPEGGSDANG